MMSLSILLVIALVVGEVLLRKFDILHVIYNQMLRLKDRRLICFNQFDVTDNREVTGPTLMMTRLTIVLVLCYIWQFCVLESYFYVGSVFPDSLCHSLSEFSCFQTPMRWDSFLRAGDMTQIDCSKGSVGFVPVDASYGVACFRVIQQNAAIWLQSLAVGNALGLFLTRIYEVLVWLAVSSVACLIATTLLCILTVIAVIGATFVGIASSLSNSWLGFMAMAVLPFLLFVVRACAMELRKIKRKELERIQRQTKADFNKIALEFASGSEVSYMTPQPIAHQGDIRQRPSSNTN
jgi:hypothetical protein